MINNEEVSPELLAIRNRFVESLPERVTRLHEAKLHLEADKNSFQVRAAIETMFDVTHQLTGTAGSVGFVTLSNIAREINLSLRRVREEDQNKLEDDFSQELFNDLEKLNTAVEDCYK